MFSFQYPLPLASDGVAVLSLGGVVHVPPVELQSLVTFLIHLLGLVALALW